MLLLLAALSVGLAAFLAAEAATYPARRRRDFVDRIERYGGVEVPAQDAGPQEAGPSAVGRTLLLPFAKLATPFVPPKARKALDKRLLSAGLSRTLTPEHVLGFKGLGLVFGVLVGALAVGTKPVLGIFVGLMFGLISFILPDVLINSRISSRREHVQAALPDALDLLAVSVEAGLGFDGAVAKLTETMHGPLIEEFELALNEMRIGESRSEALRRMAGRMDAPQLTTFVRAVIQADQLGSSLASILRIQAADARLRRQLAAEEKAMQLPVKMLFPLVMFILPSLFIIILGPALQAFGKA
jgi:tight adherence protein C